MMKASVIVHNICYFCYDEFNSRYSSVVAQNMKVFLNETAKIFEENIKFFFEIGINFPNSKKDNIISNVLFPMIVVNPTVNSFVISEENSLDLSRIH